MTIKQIILVVEFTIAKGKVDTFKKLFREALEVTKRKDLGVLSYQLYFNDDETKCYSIEHYRDSDAVLGHLESVASVSGPLFEVCGSTRFEIFGEPSPKLLKAFESSAPHKYMPWEGFFRP